MQFLNVTEPPFHGGLTLMLRESVLITWVPRCPMLTQCQYCALVKHFPRSAMFLCVRDRLSLADEGHCMSLLIKTEDTEDKVHTSQVICNSRQASHRDRHAGAETIFFSQQRACQSLVSVSCYPKRCCILCYIGHYHTMLNMNVSFGSVVTQRV